MRVTTALAGVFLGMGLMGCATKTVTLPPSAELPAAQGEAKVSKDKNNNTLVRLNVKHFAPPQRLNPPKAVYVVWLETPDHQMHNIGQLKVNNDLEGKLETITPYEVFQVIITAEDFATVTEPGPQVVLRTKAIATP